MTALASLLFAAGGLASLSLSLPRHARQVGQQVRKVPERGWRAAGWIALALSLMAVATNPQWRFALVQWVGLIGLAAGIVVIFLWQRPAWLVKIMAAAWSAAALLTLLAFA